MFLGYYRLCVFFLNLIGLLAFMHVSYAQCVNPAFNLPASVCKDENVFISATPVVGESYTWDFCGGDLQNTPVAQSVVQVGEAAALTGVNIVEDNGSYYMFVTGRSTNNIVRINLGSNPRNANPTKVNLGSLGGILSVPGGIKIIKESGQWYGIVYNAGNDNLVRVSFGTSLTNNTPTAQNVVKAYGAVNNGLEIGVTNNKVVALITNPQTDKITLVNFGSSITNNPTDPADVLTTGTVPGAGALRDISLIQVCEKWYAYTVTSLGNKIFRLEFGANLFSMPVITDVTGVFSIPDNLVGVRMLSDGSSYTAFAMTIQRVVYRLDFGNSPMNLPSKTNLGNLAIAAGTFLFFDFIKHSSSWSFFAGQNDAASEVFRADFPNTCSASLQSFKGDSPGFVSYSAAGSYSITLEVRNSNGDLNKLTKSITIQNASAPVIAINSTGMCLSNALQFSVSTTSPLSTVAWKFGDGGISSLETTSHLYTSAGTYLAEIDIEATNGCKNYTSKSITVYNDPVPDFSVPAGLLCTNNNYTFSNLTPDAFAGNLTYQWFVNGNTETTTRDLTYAFSSNGAQSIKLVTSIPGCSAETTKVTSNVEAGPVVDFLAVGNCQQTAVIFTNQSVGTISGFNWNFGDGSPTSTITDESHVFNSKGNYTVSLQAMSSNGCENITSKNIIIYSKPQPDFSLSLPPFSCSGSVSQFNDQTGSLGDSFLSSWLWNFNDPTSSQNSSTASNPQHVYADAGLYNVSLTVGTNFGCTATIQKQVVVAQSPTANFANTPSCVNVPVNFTDVSSGNIQSWYWDMGNTTYFFSTPTHIYTTPGSYQVDLSVVAENNCIANVTKMINVPKTIVPDFSVERNCNGQNTAFTDITSSLIDPISTIEWEFGTFGSGGGSPATFTFASPGDVNVKMKATTASGCAYANSKNVSIVKAPTASFTASPESGVPPLTVLFTNTSTDATNYAWQFYDEDNSTSNEVSPSFTFENYGDYAVDLTASNTKGCTTVVSKIIRAILPVKDIAVTALVPIENLDGSLKIIATLKNNSNVEVHDFSIELDLSGFTSVREKITNAIPGNAIYNHVFNYEISNPSRLNYLCATTELADDINTDNDLKCVSLTDIPVLMEPYPNPANQSLYLSMVANSSSSVSLTLLDALGKEILNGSYSINAGLNDFILPLGTVKDGIYILILNAGTIRQIRKISVSH